MLSHFCKRCKKEFKPNNFDYMRSGNIFKHCHVCREYARRYNTFYGLKTLKKYK